MATRSKSFNTTGPCRPEMHYMLPPEARLPSSDLQRLIDEELYWVLHAPRQTGKTSFLMSWMRTLNASEQVVACYVTVERCQGIEEVEEALPSICHAVAECAGKMLESKYVPGIPRNAPASSALAEQLTAWSELCAPKPLVVLFDEVDTLSGATLISFLRQLRGGFASRGVGRFSTSVALVGMRDLKDYLVHTKDGVAVNPGSPFNIKEQSHTLRNFNEPEVRALLSQHTEATGQVFTEEALSDIFRLTCGQPWLVNALAKECVLRLVPDGSPITSDHIEAAKEALIKSRAVHIDSLAERLRDPKVKRVVEPILAGASDPTLAEGDEFRLCLDLGLVTLDDGVPGIANPIYREVLIRTLNMSNPQPVSAHEHGLTQSGASLDQLQRNAVAVRISVPLYDPDDFEGLPGLNFGRLTITVDLATGRIREWPVDFQGQYRVYDKVRDEGSYQLLDRENTVIASLDGYVPDDLVPGMFGDYIDLDIKNGEITNWHPEPDLKSFLDVEI